MSAITSARTIVTASTSLVQVIASNAFRCGAYITNTSTVNCRLVLGSGGSSTDYSIILGPNDRFESTSKCYQSTISAVWDIANGSALVTESSNILQPPSYGTARRTQVSAASGTQLILASNDTRVSCFLTNTSTDLMYIVFNAGGSATDYTLQLGAGLSTELAGDVFTGDIYGIWLAPNAPVLVTEITP